MKKRIQSIIALLVVAAAVLSQLPHTFGFGMEPAPPPFVYVDKESSVILASSGGKRSVASGFKKIPEGGACILRAESTLQYQKRATDRTLHQLVNIGTWLYPIPYCPALSVVLVTDEQLGAFIAYTHTKGSKK